MNDPLTTGEKTLTLAEMKEFAWGAFLMGAGTSHIDYAAAKTNEEVVEALRAKFDREWDGILARATTAESR